MRIGIIGWYGHRNFGDERILYCLKRHLENHELYIVGGWGEARVSLSELNRCDYVLIGGGGLILRGCSAHIDIIERLRVPFSCVGISVEAEHREMRPFLELLKERAERVIVRDAESEKILGRHPKIEIAPDLTFLYPLPVSALVETDTCGLNLRPWFFWKAQLHGAFHRFMARQARFQRLIDYYPLPKWNPAEIVPELRRHFGQFVSIPFYFEAGEENDATLMRRFFHDVPDDFDALRYGRIRYLVGMRFHAIVLSVQAGVPFLSLSYQPKNINFCRDIGLEQLSVDIFQWRKQLPEKIGYLRKNYMELRQLLLERRNEYAINVQKVMKQFTSLF